jgi:GTP-binding protein HflX
VGYTNAGKSTLMNLLTGAGAYVADKLFATLDTKTRRWNLENSQTVLLSDTVGFVRDLPHHLVASFRATLEEAIWADLLIHVADASYERVSHEIAAVEKVLQEIGCGDNRRLLVMNKIDKIEDPTVLAVLGRQYPQALFLSAATGKGTDKLADAVLERIGGQAVAVTLTANCGNGRLMQYIAQHAEVLSQTYNDATATIEATMAENRLSELAAFGSDVTIHRNGA